MTIGEQGQEDRDEDEDDSDVDEDNDYACDVALSVVCDDSGCVNSVDDCDNDAGDIHDHRGLRERRWQRPRCRHLNEDGGMVADDDGDGADYDDPRKSRDRCRD